MKMSRSFCLLLLLSVSAAVVVLSATTSAPVPGAPYNGPFAIPSNIPECLGPPGSTKANPLPTCYDAPTKVYRDVTFVLARTWLPGFPKAVITVNGSYPGPPLTFNQYDIVRITVINNLDNDTSLHFHGMRQYQTPQNDGVLGLSQCPIPINATMTYEFCADRVGSFWYHGHRTMQYADGLYGTYIIKPYGGDIYAPQYDYDIPILVSDWYDAPTDSFLPWFLSPASAGIEPVPNQFIMNGRFTQQIQYSLPADGKVRLRFISAATFSLFNVSIDGYTMTVIEVDGIDTYPYQTNAFPLNVAQRVSVLVDLSKDANTWAQSRSAVYIRAVASPKMFDPDQIPGNQQPNMVAVLNLCQSGSNAAACASLPAKNAGLIQPAPLPTSAALVNSFTMPVYTLDYDFTVPVYANSPTIMNDINMMDLKPLYPAFQTSNIASCYTQFYSDIHQPQYILPLVFAFNTDQFGINRGMFNGITYDPLQQYTGLYKAPLQTPQPLMHNMMTPQPGYTNIINNMANNWMPTDPADLTSEVGSLFSGLDDGQGGITINYVANSYNATAPESASDWNMIMGNQLGQYLLPGNATVELLVINTDTGSHPIHLHGYSFWLVESSDTFSTMQPPYILRDVLSLPPNGWIKIRIQTDNPGVWVIHCHISWHFEAGLAAVLIDNLPALQTDPKFSYANNVKADAIQNCVNYAPTIPAAPLTGGCVTVATDNDFNFVADVNTASKYAITACVIIMLEAFIGLLFFKLNVLEFCLAELICVNIGTLVGAVFIEFQKELYEQILIAGTLTYTNVTIVMCFGFLFPLCTEKYFKRGKTNKFKLLTKANEDAKAVMAKKKTNDDDTEIELKKMSSMSTLPEGSPELHAKNIRSPTMASQSSSSQNLLARSDSLPSLHLQRAQSLESVTEQKEQTIDIQKDTNEVVFHFDVVDGKTTASTNGELAKEIDNDTVSPTMAKKLDDSENALDHVSDPVKPMPKKPLTEEQLAEEQFKQKAASTKSAKLAAAMTAEGGTDWNIIFIVLAGESIDTFVDGGVIAAAFLASSATGLASAAGVFMEELTHMTGSFAVFVAAGAPVWKCVVINMISASFLLLGAGFILAAAQIPGIAVARIDYLMAFAAGSYLYIALVDLTPLITQMPWRGWWRSTTQILAVAFGIFLQACIAIYHWKSGTS